MTRSFRTYWIGQGVSNVGDGFSLVAFPLLVLQATGSIAQMGLVTALRAVAQAGAAVVAGSIVDRAHRRRLMIACDATRFALMVSLALSWLGGARPMALVYLVAMSTAALGNTFLVGSIAAVSNLVERDELTRAQSRIQGTQALAYIVGPALAGLVVSRFGVGWAVLVDALSFAVSAATLASIRLRQDRPPDTTRRAGVVADLRTGLRFLFGHPLLRDMTLLMLPVALLNSGGLSSAGVVDLVVFHLRHDLGRSGTAVGLTLATAALGALLGALSAPAVRRRFGFGSCFIGGTGVQAMGLVVMGLVGTAPATTAGAALWAAGLTLRVVPAVAVRQAIIPDAMLGRVTGASWLIVFAAGALGSAAISRIAAGVGVTRVMTAIGTLVGVVAVAGLFTRVRTADPEAWEYSDSGGPAQKLPGPPGPPK